MVGTGAGAGGSAVPSRAAGAPRAVAAEATVAFDAPAGPAAAADAAGPAAVLAPEVVSARLRELPAAGVDLQALVGLLLARDVADLSAADLVAVVVGWQQVAGMVAVAQAAAVSELAARRPVSASFPGDDLACALSISGHGAAVLVGRSHALAEHVVLAEALRAGVLDVRKVDVLLAETINLPHGEAETVLRAVLADAEGLTAALLRDRARRLVAAVDPDAARKRAVKARAQRCVRLDHAGEAMAWVSALLPAPDAVAAFSVIDALAHAAHSAGDTRGVAQRRADVFADIFTAILDTGATPGGMRVPHRGGQPLGVHLTIAASTLNGLDDLPAQLAGYGPIPADLARDLATHATRYRAASIDPDGHLTALSERTFPMPTPASATGAGGDAMGGAVGGLHAPNGADAGTHADGANEAGSKSASVAGVAPNGSPATSGTRGAAGGTNAASSGTRGAAGGAPPGTAGAAGGDLAETSSPGPWPGCSPAPGAVGYRPGAGLRRFVIARDQTCTFPGCRQPATGCDLDHIDPYDHDRSPIEQTTAANLQPLCRHHHRTKTLHGWRMHRDPTTGDTHTTSPNGLTYGTAAGSVDT